MLRVWKSIRLGALALLACMAAGEAGAGVLGPSELNRLGRQFDRRPMIFFVAKGPVDSCGRGCSEWIAAIGSLDKDAPQRLLDFIEKLNGRKLPVFFHSPGGLGVAGTKIGTILRERRMASGVARTEANCSVFDRGNSACQRKIRAGEAIAARLVTRDAVCASACVYAFAGASSRQIAPGALIGVHASGHYFTPKQALLLTGKADTKVSFNDEKLLDVRRNYYLDMGINPDFANFSSKTPYEKMYILDREEIARFGLETKVARYETPWILTSGSQAVKSVTRRTFSEPAEYLTFWIRLSCSWDRRTFLSYRREMAFDPNQTTEFSRLTFDEWFLELRPSGLRGDIEIGSFPSSLDDETLVKFVTARTATITEKTKANAAQEIEITISNAGLAPAVVGLLKRCGLQPIIPSTLIDQLGEKR